MRDEEDMIECRYRRVEERCGKTQSNGYGSHGDVVSTNVFVNLPGKNLHLLVRSFFPGRLRSRIGPQRRSSR